MNNVDTSVSGPSEVNKVLVIGHPLSGLETVHTLLENAGMHTANPSRREKMHPREITATLLKANRKRITGDTIEQVDVSPVWNGLALDLMMGNLDHEMWCWADPDALPLLEYWNDLDERLAFVLVYDAPDNFIARSFADSEEITSHALTSRLKEWNVYNRALMKFYLRHTDRSYLVQASQIRSNSSEYLEDVRKQLGLPLLSDIAAHNIIEDMDHTEPQSVLYSYLAQLFLQHHPDTLQLYDELQSVANIAYDQTRTDPLTLDAAWNAAVHMNQNSMRKLRAAEDTAKQLQLEKQQIQNETTASLLKEKELFAGESSLLLIQLYHIQEELERKCTENQKTQDEKRVLTLAASEQTNALKEHEIAIVSLTKERDRLSNRNNQLLRELQHSEKRLKEHVAAFEKEKRMFSEKTVARADIVTKNNALQTKLDQAEKRVLEQTKENELLLEQLHNIQMEIKRKNHTSMSRPVGAVDRVKQQLSYRLGATMIEKSRNFSGWVSMPTALMRETRAYRKEFAQRSGKKLPPIHTYADAHEAEQVKKHLSYRLGKVVVDAKRNPLKWGKLPWTVSKTVREFRQEKKHGHR